MKAISMGFLYFLSLASSIQGSPLPTALPSPGQPNIKILSDQMDCDQAHNVCVAKGNAIAEKLGDTQTKILKGDQITVYFTKEAGTGPLKLARLEAEGKVFFITGDIIVQGKRGNYLADSEVAEVFEDVKITSGKNQLEGSYGRVDLKTGHYSVKREGARVQALIFTKNEGKTENNSQKGPLANDDE